jgi:hypothetical protein
MTILPNLSRRELLSRAATVSVAGIASDIAFDAHARSEIAQEAQALALPSKEAQAQNFGAVTLLCLREIAERNEARKEARLPLLSVPRELRRMSTRLTPKSSEILLRHIGVASTKRCWRGFGGNAATRSGLRLACSQVVDCGLRTGSMSN